MVASGLRTSIIVASLLGVAAAGMGQDTLDKYRTQLANMAPQQGMPPPSDGAIASTIAQWKALNQTDALPFDSYASFLLVHPGWPNEAAIRRAAERQAAIGSAAPASVVAFFRHYPPTSPSATVAFARALWQTGASPEATEAARQAWRAGPLAPGEESFVLATFGSTLRPDDHDARMDALLWAGQTAAAARELPLTSPARQPEFQARLSLRSNAADAGAVAMNTQTLYGSDPGYVADRAVWLRNNNGSARDWLALPRTLTAAPANPGKWLDVLLTNADAAANDHQWQTCYDIARQVAATYPEGTDVGDRSYAERDAYTDLAWLGGQTALKKLARPADAMTLFDRYAHGSRSPAVRSKGFYWAGRAAQAAGRAGDATAYFQQAAAYRDLFYGQLAAEKLGEPLTPPTPLATVAVDPAARSAFDAREIVKAARFTGQIADWQDQTLFLRQIAADAKTANDHLLAADLSRSLNRPDLAVMVGRNALANGLTDYSAAGFPTMPVPAGYERSWTVIHAISRQESQFDRTAVSRAGARGLMQLMPGTAREQSGKIGLAYSADSLTSDPQISMMLGSSYFDRIFQQFGSYPLAIAAYNAGAGNVNKWLTANGDPRTGSVDMVDWIEAIPFSETRNYVERVLENAVVYDLMNPARSNSRGDARLSWYLGRSRAG